MTMVEDEDWNLPPEDVTRVINALAYFANAKDLIPDDVPGLGFLDDAVMVDLVMRELAHEVKAYDSLYDEAVKLMQSEDLKAFDISGDSARSKYGSDRFGQGCLLARRLVEVQAEGLARLQHRLAAFHLADAQLGPLHVGENADGALDLRLDLADGFIARAVVVVTAVAEVEAEDVGAGAEQLADLFLGRAGGAERGYDLCFSLASDGAECTQVSETA